MVQQRSRQESLADEAQREKNTNKKDNKALIDRLRKFLEKSKGQYEFKGMKPYRPPSWFKRVDPKTLPNDLEKRFKNAENYFLNLAKKEKRGISDKDMEDMSNAKGGKIKVYAKGGGVRKPSY